MKKIFTLIQILGISTYLLAQKNVEFEKENFPDKKSELKDAKRNIESGDEYFDVSMKGTGYHLYGSALPFYEKAQAFNPNNALLNYKLGKCYLETDNPVNALKHMQIAYKLNPKVGANILYYLAEAYHVNLEFEKAIKAYEEYRATLQPTQKEDMDDVDRKIFECRNGMEYVANPVLVFIDNVGQEINSSFPDYGPVISADESVMMFTSRRDNTTGGGKDPSNLGYFEDVYISTRQANGKWSAAQNMGKPVNRDVHDATVSMTADGQKFYVYIDEDKGDIYECELKGTEWRKPQRLNSAVNTKDNHEASASISADGQTIYFVTDKPGGFGRHDIYQSTWDPKKERWNPAVNLGPTINTPYNEHAVFIHPDGKTLFFSSQGHKTMGGYDIFKSVYDDKRKRWSTPENIGYPINSPANDIDFVLSANGKHAYFSSVKPDGYGEKDIYMITFITPKYPVLNTEDNLLASLTEPITETVIAKEVEVPVAAVSILKGSIFDAVTKDPLEADIELVDNELNQVIATFKSNSATGKFLVSLPAGKNYGIAVKKEGYLFHSENFDIPLASGSQEYVKDIGLKNIAVGTKIVLRNIFFDFDKATLRPESKYELGRLIKLLNDVPSMKIEIGGHTDSKGSDEYNMKLSASRAASVVDYLVMNGISKDRLTSQGYGETKPMATNDTEDGRQLNRRTEFEIKSK